jgi:hypothetical protein
MQEVATKRTFEEVLTSGKKVDLNLVGLDGNAFALMGAFKRQAQRERWPKEDVDAVLDKCTSGDYNNLLCALMEVCEPKDGVEDQDDGDFDEDEVQDDGDFDEDED